MVQVQEVLRHLLRPLEHKFKVWEAAPGFKGKLGRWFRIGKVPTGVVESWSKALGQLYMMLYMFTQRPWGPLYKRLFEFDMHPAKFTYPFARHRWILFFWFGHTFLEDYNHVNTMAKDQDYLLYYIFKYSRQLPRNSLNYRTSAHYLEISHIYTVEMTKKFLEIEKKMTQEHERKKALRLA